MHKKLYLLAAMSISTAAAANTNQLALEEINVVGERNENSALNLDDTIKTGSRLGLTLREMPASVSVADRAFIEAQGALDTQNVVNTLPGINASANPGYGGFVTYRGFSQNQITQLFNGIGMSYSSSNRPVDAWIYDRVELIGGPSTFLYGAGAVGGSINYITKVANREENDTQARIRYGSYDNSELSVGANQALNPDDDIRHYARIDVSRTSGNGYIDRNKRESTSIATSLLSDISPKLSHTLALEYQEDREESPYWGSPILNPVAGTMRIDEDRRFENYNVEDGRYEQRVQWARSITDYKFSEATSLQNTFYHYQAQRDYRNLENYIYNSDNTQINRSSAYLQRHDQTVNGNRIELRHDNFIIGLPTKWSAGFDISHNQQILHPLSTGAYDTIDPDHFDPDSFYDIPGVAGGLKKVRKHDVKTQAVFFENSLNLTDNLSLLTGLRYDDLNMEVTNYGTVTATNPAFFKRHWNPITGRAGLVYKLSPMANAYVQYSTAADPPAGGLASATFSQVQNFDLSKGSQIEVGSKFELLDGRASATIAAYEIVREDFAIRNPNNPLETIQAGQQTSRGIELAGKLQATSSFLLEGNVAFVDAQYDDFYESISGVAVSREGNAPTNVPDYVANLWLTYAIAPQWEVGADARHVALVYADNANTLKAPAYTLYGAFARYTVKEGTTITARARNLTDEIYAKQAYGTLYYQGAPRTFEVAIDTHF